MIKANIAAPLPHDAGGPALHTPAVYGASPHKPFLYRIPVTGERPMRIWAEPGLPTGLILDETTGIMSGQAEQEGEFVVTLTAENRHGRCQKPLRIRIAEDGICRTPLMGWTSWNAFRWEITQEKIMETARLLRETGLADYGYQYINIDSAWQGAYGGPYDAIQPNAAFPAMWELCGFVHELGLKCGIYSTPMRNAWGLAESASGLPGCTRGERDERFSNPLMGGIGQEHCEQNNVRQWAEWGFDYLKYDWAECDEENAEKMKQCLLESGRDFAYAVTVRAGYEQAAYWSRRCSSWRDNPDSQDNWERLMLLFAEADKWSCWCCPGHFFDLDMLETGWQFGGPCALTEEEQVLAYSFRAMFPSPLQISCDLSKLTPFDLALLCNEEVIAVNQDELCVGARCIFEERSEEAGSEKHIKLYWKPLADGGAAVGFFNFGDTSERAVLPLKKSFMVRDLWKKTDLGRFGNVLALELEPHTARLVRLRETRQ